MCPTARDELLAAGCFAHALVREGIIEAGLLGRARAQKSDDRFMRLVAGIKAAAPDHTLQQIAAQLTPGASGPR